MNIGEVAERSGLPAKTIRYYEDIGLVEPLRSANGYRVYGDQELNQLAFLGRARSLGFTIEECRLLLALYRDPHRSSSDVKEVARTHLAHIDRKIVELSSMRNTLSHLIKACAGDDRPDCPILEDLAADQKG
ncbi:MAG: Cu(I)-responsive transcriptional regulator [Paracoccaceae bacterium]|nr:Cu(I)-responsive transcriptional regulator [Paracoccaceae bacterium]